MQDTPTETGDSKAISLPGVPLRKTRCIASNQTVDARHLNGNCRQQSNVLLKGICKWPHSSFAWRWWRMNSQRLWEPQIATRLQIKSIPQAQGKRVRVSLDEMRFDCVRHTASPHPHVSDQKQPCKGVWHTAAPNRDLQNTIGPCRAHFSTSAEILFLSMWNKIRIEQTSSPCKHLRSAYHLAKACFNLLEKGQTSSTFGHHGVVFTSVKSTIQLLRSHYRRCVHVLHSLHRIQD